MNHETACYWANLALQTRRYGHCYVHVGARPYNGYTTEDGMVIFTFSGWGRSLQSGGHKYKVHANHAVTGKPVSTTALKIIARP